MGLYPEAALGQHRVDQRRHLGAGEAGVAEVALRASRELIPRPLGQQLLQLPRGGEQHIIVDIVMPADGHAVLDDGARLGAADEEAVLPLGEVHMADLPVIQDADEVHAQGLQSALPMRQGAFAVAGAACVGVVVEVAEVESAALVEGIQAVDLGGGGFGDFGHGGASLGE